MRLKLFFWGLIVVILVSSCASVEPKSVCKYEPYPKFEDVVHYFFENYSIKDFQDKSINFRKDKNGWQIQIMDRSAADEVLDEFEVWEIGTTKFKKINIDKVSDPNKNETKMNEYLNDDSFIHLYNCCPYYGYLGWEQDVINDFKNISQYSDSLICGIARAYSDYASSLLTPRLNFADSLNSFNLSENEYTMTDEQLKEFRSYAYKSLDLYEIIAERNPGFNTVVGPVELKLSNDKMNLFYETYIFKSYTDAINEIDDIFYDDVIITLAKNYLNSCPKNTILFTYGDNDTYPLLYVQNKLNYRTDVSVVCIPFLQTDWYVNFIREGGRYANGIPIEIPISKIKNNKREVFYYLPRSKDERDNRISVDLFLKYVLDDKISVQDYYEDEIYSYANNKLFLNVNPENVIENKLVSIENKNRIEQKVNFDLSKSHILKMHLIILDILSENDWERPIAFTSVSGGTIKGLENYFEKSGYVYLLNPVYNESGVRIDPENYYNYLMNTMIWFDLDSVKPYYNEVVSFTLKIIKLREDFGKLAVKFSESGDKDRALEVMMHSKEIMPYDFFVPSVFEVQYANGWYEIGFVNEGDEYLLFMVDRVSKELQEFSKLDDKNRSQNHYDISLAIETYRRVLISLEQYNRDTLYSDFQPEFNKYLIEFDL